MLAAASMNPYSKPAPLYTERDGGPMIRIRALQHMTIIHLRRVLAGEVAEIIETETADAEQMERIRKTLNHYGEYINLDSGNRQLYFEYLISDKTYYKLRPFVT